MATTARPRGYGVYVSALATGLVFVAVSVALQARAEFYVGKVLGVDNSQKAFVLEINPGVL
jgi:hypothetical protein